MPSNDAPRTPSRSDGTPSRPNDVLSTLERELAFLVRWLEAVQRRRTYALERAHYLMLLLLMQDGPQSVSRIAERLRLDASTVTRQVAVMTRRGLVHKQPNPEDRRGGMICATEIGRQEATRMRQQREERIDALFADWPEAKRLALVDALSDLNDSLCRVLDEGDDSGFRP